MAHAWKIASSSGSSRRHDLILELTDEQGLTGLGEAAPASTYDETYDGVAEFIQQVDPRRLSFRDLPASLAYLETLPPDPASAHCALNLALVDGAARLAGLPVYDFFKLGFRENHHVTSFSIGIDDPDVIGQKVEAAAAFPVLKLKVGDPRDRENFRALRAAAPTKAIRLDANEAWTTREQALEMIEWFARDPHVQYIEQPLHRSASDADLRWLKARSPMPIFADESCHTVRDIPRCAECFHGVNVKLVKTGGLTMAVETLQAARKHGLKTMIGCMIETSILISAGAHLAELADYLDLDGNILITNDPYRGATSEKGIISFHSAPVTTGLRVAPR